jgi:septum formation protein
MNGKELIGFMISPNAQPGSLQAITNSPCVLRSRIKKNRLTFDPLFLRYNMNASLQPQPHLHPRPLILGSSSKYRKELLSRLQWPFECVNPDIDETPLSNEGPMDLSLRLAQEKALHVSLLHPQAIVIGSDQVADLQGKPLGKPLNHEKARLQLSQMSGQTVFFHTSVCVSCKESAFLESFVSTVKVVFKVLTPLMIESYLLKDKPYDCAGSAKSESLGVALLERIESDDPSSLIGLPLIRTTSLLAKAGLDVLSSPPQPHPAP